MHVCSAMGEHGTGEYHPCGNIATSWRAITVDHWAIRVDLCPAHATLWNSDVNTGLAISLTL
jgi:hypothetical protein